MAYLLRYELWNIALATWWCNWHRIDPSTGRFYYNKYISKSTRFRTPVLRGLIKGTVSIVIGLFSGNVKFQQVENSIYNAISFSSHHTYLGMPQLKVQYLFYTKCAHKQNGLGQFLLIYKLLMYTVQYQFAIANLLIAHQ